MTVEHPGLFNRCGAKGFYVALTLIRRMVIAEELISTLQENGYKMAGKREKYVVMRNGPSQIIIPSKGNLAPNVVSSILSQAGIERDAVSDKKKTAKPQIIEEKINKDADTREYQRDVSMGFLRSAWEAESRIFTLGVYRVVIGILFLISALSKAPWNDFGWLPLVVDKAVQYPTFGFYATFMENVVRPNLVVFGWLQFLIELFIGLSLILGLFVVGSGFIGQFWVINIWMIAASWPTEWAWTYIMLVFSMVLFWTCKAGRSLGIDQTLVDKAEAYSEHSTAWAMIRWLV